MLPNIPPNALVLVITIIYRFTRKIIKTKSYLYKKGLIEELKNKAVDIDFAY